MSIAERVAEVRHRIAEAAERAGRDPAGITLVAVTKTVSPARIAEAIAAGITDAGENRTQELEEKQAAVHANIRWHFIGVLQRNKVKAVAGRVALVHSVTRLDLAQSIAERSLLQGMIQDVLLEVNTAGEATKAGVSPREAEEAAEQIGALAGLRLRGLMTMAPLGTDPRPAFRALRGLRERILAGVPGAMDLSMGMSGDFEVAIEEGATIVRIGTAIFGRRPPHATL